MTKAFTRQTWLIIMAVATLLAFATQAFSTSKKMKVQPLQKTQRIYVHPSPHYYIER